MKKAVSIVMVSILLIAALTACGSKDDVSQSGDYGSQTEITEQDGVSEPNPEQTADEESNAADVPMDTEEDEETLERQYMATIFEAYQNLDAEAMKPFIGDDYEDVVRVFNLIKEDPEDLEFWNNTIGNMVYLPDSDALITKSCDYVAAKWYTDCWKNNEEIPASASENFPKEYLDEIYSKYYVDAPYTIEYNFAEQIITEWNDGAKCHLSSLTDVMGMNKLSFILYEPNHLRAAILLNREEFFSFGYEYIAEDIPGYKDLMSKDLDKMMEIVDDLLNVENPTKYSAEEAYKNYFMNDEVRAVLQQFFNDKCEVYRDVGTIRFFYPLDIDNLSSYWLTQEDKDIIKSMDATFVYNAGVIRSFPERLSNNFYMYRELIDCAKSFGLVE